MTRGLGRSGSVDLAFDSHRAVKAAVTKLSANVNTTIMQNTDLLSDSQGLEMEDHRVYDHICLSLHLMTWSTAEYMRNDLSLQRRTRQLQRMFKIIVDKFLKHIESFVIFKQADVGHFTLLGSLRRLAKDW